MARAPQVSRRQGTRSVSLAGAGAGQRDVARAYSQLSETAQDLMRSAMPSLARREEQRALRDFQNGSFRPRNAVREFDVAYNRAGIRAYEQETRNRARVDFERLSHEVLQDGSVTDVSREFLRRAEALQAGMVEEAEPFFANSLRDITTSEITRLSDNMARRQLGLIERRLDSQTTQTIDSAWAEIFETARRDPNWQGTERGQTLLGDIRAAQDARVESGALLGTTRGMEDHLFASKLAMASFASTEAQIDGWVRDLGPDAARQRLEGFLSHPDLAGATDARGVSLAAQFRSSGQAAINKAVAQRNREMAEHDRAAADYRRLLTDATAEIKQALGADPDSDILLGALDTVVSNAQDLAKRRPGDRLAANALQDALDLSLEAQERASIEGLGVEELRENLAGYQSLIEGMADEGVAPTPLHAKILDMYEKRISKLETERRLRPHSYAAEIGRPAPSLDISSADGLRGTLGSRVAWAWDESAQQDGRDIPILTKEEAKQWANVLGQDPNSAASYLVSAWVSINNDAPPGSDTADLYRSFLAEAVPHERGSALAQAGSLLMEDGGEDAAMNILRGAHNLNLPDYQSRVKPRDMRPVAAEVAGQLGLNEADFGRVVEAATLHYEGASSTSMTSASDDFDDDLASQSLRAVLGESVDSEGATWGGIASRGSRDESPTLIPPWMRQDRFYETVAGLQFAEWQQGADGQPLHPTMNRDLTEREWGRVRWGRHGSGVVGTLDGQPIRTQTGGASQTVLSGLWLDLDVIRPLLVARGADGVR